MLPVGFEPTISVGERPQMYALDRASTGTGMYEINPLTPNDPYRDRTAPLISKVAFYIFIQQIYVLNILNVVYALRFFIFKNAVCFIILTYLVTVLLTFHIQGVLKLKKNNSGAKRLTEFFMYLLLVMASRSFGCCNIHRNTRNFVTCSLILVLGSQRRIE